MTADAPWKWVAASVVGTSHLARQTPCQDYAAQALIHDEQGHEMLAIAVADGAGSAAHSELGSALVCEGFLDFVRNTPSIHGLTREAIQAWLTDIRTQLHLAATSAGHEMHEYASTFLAAVITDACAVFVQIGDGAIVIRDCSDSAWEAMFWPEHGEYANTTTFVTSNSAPDALQYATRSDIREVALFTDGIENLVLNKLTQSAHHPFFSSMFEPVRALREQGMDVGLAARLAKYLGSPGICSRTDDDKTLVLASRRGGVP